MFSIPTVYKAQFFLMLVTYCQSPMGVPVPMLSADGFKIFGLKWILIGLIKAICIYSRIPHF